MNRLERGNLRLLQLRAAEASDSSRRDREFARLQKALRELEAGRGWTYRPSYRWTALDLLAACGGGLVIVAAAAMAAGVIPWPL